MEGGAAGLRSAAHLAPGQRHGTEHLAQVAAAALAPTRADLPSLGSNSSSYLIVVSAPRLPASPMKKFGWRTPARRRHGDRVRSRDSTPVAQRRGERKTVEGGKGSEICGEY